MVRVNSDWLQVSVCLEVAMYLFFVYTIYRAVFADPDANYSDAPYLWSRAMPNARRQT